MRSLLTPHVWLEIDVINAFLSCYASPAFVIVNNNEWELMTSRSEVTLLTSIDWKRAKHIVVPRHEPAHFTLLWFDTVGTFAYINTIQEVEGYNRKARQYLANWNKLVTTPECTNLGLKPYRFTEVDYNYQQDSNSCGVLVSMLAECIAMGTDLKSVQTDQSAILSHRDHMWQVFEDNRDTERCTKCRLTDDPKNKSGGIDKWLTCEKCKNWFHYGCANVSYALHEDDVRKLKWSCGYCMQSH